MSVIIISAQSQNGIIGRDGKLPWDVPEEYQHFIDSVKGQVMLMGRKSWEVFGADIETMANGIISRQHDIDGADAVFDDLLSAINWAKNLCSEHVFIAGGAQIYKWALNSDLVDELWLSTLPFTCEGDAHFPQFDASKWNVEREEREAYVFEMWKKLK